MVIISSILSYSLNSPWSPYSRVVSSMGKLPLQIAIWSNGPLAGSTLPIFLYINPTTVSIYNHAQPNYSAFLSVLSLPRLFPIVYLRHEVRYITLVACSYTAAIFCRRTAIGLCRSNYHSCCKASSESVQRPQLWRGSKQDL